MVEYRNEIGAKDIDILVNIYTHDEKYVKAQRKQQLFLVIAGILIFASGLFIKEYFFCAFGILALLLGILVIPVLNKSRIVKSFKKLDPRVTGGERCYKVDDNGIEITSFAGTGHNNWEAMAKYGENDNYIWLQRVDSQVILFDKSVLTEEQEAELKSLIKTHMS